MPIFFLEGMFYSIGIAALPQICAGEVLLCAGQSRLYLHLGSTGELVKEMRASALLQGDRFTQGSEAAPC